MSSDPIIQIQDQIRQLEARAFELTLLLRYQDFSNQSELDNTNVELAKLERLIGILKRGDL